MGEVSSGKLYTFVGRSGAGKTSICTALLSRFPFIKPLPSYTSRARCQNEKENIYHFVAATFFQSQKKKFSFVTEYGGNYYGTLTDDLHTAFSGQDWIAEFVLDDAVALWEMDQNAVEIFYINVSEETSKNRLTARGDTKESIASRMYLESDLTSRVKRHECQGVPFTKINGEDDFEKVLGNIIPHIIKP